MILNHPFFASLVLNMDFIEDNNIPTACTDGRVIMYNSKFMDTLTKDEIIGVLVHEVMHVANLHHLRRQKREPRKFNVAADYAINQLIIDSGIVLPSDALLNAKYRNKSAEEIYDLLPNDYDNGKPSIGDVADGREFDDSGTPTDSELAEEEQRVKMMVTAAAQAAQQAGKLPAGISRFISELVAAKVNWREVLSRFITEKLTSDYSWMKPNRRYSRVILPSLEAQDNIGSIALIVDTSGSIDNKILSDFASEIDVIKQMVAKEVIVIYVDSEVNKVQTFEPDDELKLSPKGGGGTSFIPGFEYLEENNVECACVIYFTDGYCDSFPQDSQWPVLWAVYNNKNFTAPFGETINL